MRRIASIVLAAALAAGAPALAQGGGEVWGADYFPNIALVSHEGKTLRFFDDVIAGKVVAIDFIYTSCPDVCPLETARMAEVQRILGERVGRDVFLYSITIDPARDTPEVLADYARRFDAGPGWLFLRGKKEEIDLLRRKLGLLRAPGEPLPAHATSMIVGNQATGQWMKVSPFENAYVLASRIGDQLHSWKRPRAAGQGYENAPKLRDLAPGESLFRTRCAACHIIAAEDDSRRPGPNLLGVTERRDRAWLARWIAEPDRMIAEGDATARELMAAYDGIPMPNLRLDAGQVELLIDFIARETRRIRGASCCEEPR